MSTKKYADTDFFLALLKGSDWLQGSARKVYLAHKNNFVVTPFTVAEIMIVCVREDIPLRETLHHMSRMAKLLYMDWEVFFIAVSYIERGVTVFDALLMAMAGTSAIVSSDNVYKKFGCTVIDLKPK